MTDAGSTAMICVCDDVTTVSCRLSSVTTGVPFPKFPPLIMTT
jgi:hypothetical protein